MCPDTPKSEMVSEKDELIGLLEKVNSPLMRLIFGAGNANPDSTVEQDEVISEANQIRKLLITATILNTRFYGVELGVKLLTRSPKKIESLSRQGLVFTATLDDHPDIITACCFLDPYRGECVNGFLIPEISTVFSAKGLYGKINQTIRPESITSNQKFPTIDDPLKRAVEVVNQKYDSKYFLVTKSENMANKAKELDMFCIDGYYNNLNEAGKARFLNNFPKITAKLNEKKQVFVSKVFMAQIYQIMSDNLVPLRQEVASA